MQAIRTRYKASFTEKADTIAELIDLVSNDSVSESELFEVKEQLHKLAGSSGMYGYQDVCDRSRSGMVAIENDDLPSLTSDLEELRSLLLGHA